MSERTFVARVAVRLKPGVNDPQGVTVLGSLHDIGYSSVRAVRVGKLIDVTFAADDETQALTQLDAMSRDLLTNPVIEDCQIELETGAEVAR